MAFYIINVKDGRVLPGTPEAAENPDYEILSDADAESVLSGSVSPSEWLSVHRGIPPAREVPMPVAETVREAEAEEVQWKGRIPAFRDQKGRVWADRGWLEKQKFDALNDISVQAGGRRFNKSEGKAALVDHVMALLSGTPPADAAPHPQPEHEDSAATAADEDASGGLLP